MQRQQDEKQDYRTCEEIIFALVAPSVPPSSLLLFVALGAAGSMLVPALQSPWTFFKGARRDGFQLPGVHEQKCDLYNNHTNFAWQRCECPPAIGCKRRRLPCFVGQGIAVFSTQKQFILLHRHH